MPLYQIKGPDGQTYEIEGPEGATKAQVVAAITQRLASQKSGISGEFQRGLESIKSSGRTALESLIGSPEEAAARGLERQAEMEQRYAEGPSLERVKRAYEQEGLLAAGKEALGQIPEAISGQLPNIGATVAGARLGAMAGSLAGPGGAIIGGLAGAVAPSLVQQFGSNIERQAAEQQARGEALDISRGRAAAAAAPQAALDVAGQLIPLGRTLAGKLLGKEIDTLLSKGSKETAEKLAEESLTKTLAKGTAVGAVAEVPTEITQQMLERWQAGLPLTSDDALAEYGQTAYQVGLLAPIGGLGRVAERAAARGQIAEEAAKKEAEEAAQARVQEQEAADVARGEELAAYQAATPQMTLPGVEPEPYASTVLPVEPKLTGKAKTEAAKAVKAAEKEDKQLAEQQAAMFTAEGKLTPFAQKMAERNAKRVEQLAKEEAAATKAAEKARTKQEREAAKQEAARLKAERQRLSKQMSGQLWFSGDKPVPRPSDVAPTEAGETFDMFAARPAAPTTEAIPEPTVRPKKGKAPVTTLTPEELPADIPADKEGVTAFGKALNIGFTANVLKKIAGKNASDPEVHAAFKEHADNPRIQADSAKKIEAFLARNPVRETPSAVPDTSVAETQQAPAGAGVSVPVSEQESEVVSAQEAGGQGLADTGVRATEPVGREGVVAGALKEEPITVEMLHGASSSFEKFTPGKPVFLSPDEKVATQYATATRRKGDTPTVYQVRATLRRPFDYQNAAHVDELLDTLHPLQERTSRKAFLDRKQAEDSLRNGDWGYIEKPAVQKALSANGFDGFYVQEYGVKNLAVLDPSNIKILKQTQLKAPKVAEPVVEAAKPKAPKDERSRLKTSAINALDNDLISENTYEAIDKELKKPAANLDYVRKLLSGEAAPKRTRAERDIGLRFAPKYTGQAFDAETRRMVEQGNHAAAINRIAQRSAPAVQSVLRKLQGLGITPKVQIGKFDMPGSGAYNTKTNTIQLDSDTGLNDHILIHELVHAALARALASPDLKVTKDFTKFFEQIKSQMGDAYGGQNLQEFAAELVGNPEFQALLKTIKAPRSESMFKRIMRAIADFFGFAPNAYESGLKFVTDALDVSEGVKATPVDEMFYGPGNFAAVGEIGMDMPRLAGDTIEQTKNTFSNLKEGGFAKMAFGLLRLDNINTLYGKTLTSIKPLLDAIEKRAGMQEQRIKEANDKYTRFIKTERKYSAAVARMSDMAIEARLSEVDILDPSFKVTPENRAEYNRIKGIFNGLPPEVQDIYRTIRKDYDSAFDEYKRMILNSVSPSLAKQLETQFTAQTKVVAYVPFLRRGDYWVEYNDPETNERAAAAFESVRERQRFIDTQLRPKGIESRTYKNLESIRFDPSKLPPTPFVAKIMKDLQEQGAAKQLSPDAIRAQMDAVYQAYLTLLPGQSIAKQFMKSKNVRGMEKDLIRGYGDIMVRWARKMANSEYGPQIDKALDEINAQAAKSGNPTIQAAAENITDQRDFLHSPTYGNLVQAATTFSYFEYIAGNISSALINLTSLPLLAWPMLSRFGFDKATNAMMSAGRTAMNDWSRGKYAKLHQALNDHGQLQHTMAREILEGRRQTTSEFTGLKAKILDGLSIPFTKTEQYNRAVTAIAAYDLAIGNGKPEAEAIQYAITTTKDVHTSGMAATAPRWMQHPIGRVFFTFKSFVWNSAFVTARAFHQAFKGESPEVRSAARRQLLGMYGMAYVFAGIKGMPFYGMTTTLGTMLQAVAGDEDEPFDIHEELRQFFGELQYKGFANYALNLEIANRAGIATDLVFRDDPRGVQESGYVISAMKQAFGPMVSYLVNAERGFNQMQEGHVTRGIEAIVPSWVRNGLKGARYMQEGALTLKGDPVDADINAWNTLMQTIGFSPADLSTTYETTSAAKGREREILNRKTKILQAFDIAVSTGDQDYMKEVQERIQSFNQAFPMIAITPDTLRRSIVARKAAERELINGVRFNKKLRPYIEEEFFEDEEE